MLLPKSQPNNTTQLVRLTDEIVAENLRDSLPQEWFRCFDDKVLWKPGEGNHPTHGWLEAVWKWLYTSFPESLEQFEGLPLIPLDNNLGFLSKASKFIFSSDSFSNSLPEVVITFLTVCGCTVLSNVPKYVNHPEIGTCIASPTPADVLNVLSRASLTNIQTKFLEIDSSQNYLALRVFLARLPDEITLSASQKRVLLQLPIFDTIQGTNTSAESKPGINLKAASSEFTLPPNFQLSKERLIISSTDNNTVALLNILNVEILKRDDVVVQFIFPDIENRSVYRNDEVDLIMQWVLENFNLKSQTRKFIERLKELPFVPTKCGTSGKGRQNYMIPTTASSVVYSPTRMTYFHLGYLLLTTYFPN